MVKVSMSGDGTLFLLDEVLAGLNLTFIQFQNMCIAAGCDYLKNIKGFGIKKAYELTKQQASDFAQALSKIRGAPESYLEDFKKAWTVFNHQTVFDMYACKSVPLQECLNALSPDLQKVCGKYLFYQ